ncbi:uncharacterized protein PHACADRAFT_202543 [Phanerochaete carnosa HHB-10118-sp]|uniref:Fungal STAND N-terminal Goodbye domain-containing protein n=1 Tax=Phanerochaete carnosa (strain HHB-10118-sp) TaxID=650164 RepID=K5UGQ6_PHACS|nr:uncharacterized protein PHACADRAFT_202543 [Phanerochaete carnosa HHB-10118-sp]EKM48661.1 hypothetical protein PHACADRAFT_202543 [Phanerochaete carnosa HHB-10118-sp]
MSGATSVVEVESVLEEHEKGFKAFRAHGKNARAIIAPIFAFTKLFVDVGGEAASASGVVPGGKAIFAAAENVSQHFNELEGLLSWLGEVLGRLHNHLQSHTVLNVELGDIFVRALIQLLNVLAICTKYVRKQVSWRSTIFRRTKGYGRTLLGHKDVEDALKKLDELTREELLANTSLTLDMVQGTDAKVELVSDNVVKLGNGIKAVSDDLRGIVTLQRKDGFSTYPFQFN